MDISIIIPAYQANKTLITCLNSIWRQESSGADLETIVVDSSPAPCRISPSVSTKIIHLPQKTLPGRARNIGVTYASGKLLLFLDADIELEKFAIKKIWAYYRNGNLVFATFLKMQKGSHMWCQRLEYYIALNQSWPRKRNLTANWLPSGSLAIDHRLFNSSKGFPETAAYEDVLLTQALAKRKDVVLSYVPDISVIHHSYPKFSDIVIKIFRFSRLAIALKTRTYSVHMIFFLVAALPMLTLKKLINIIWYNLQNAPLLEKGIFLVFLPIIIALMPVWSLGALLGFLDRFSYGKAEAYKENPLRHYKILR